MKKLIAAAWKGRSLDQDKLHRSLMQYRNTPCPRVGRFPRTEALRAPSSRYLASAQTIFCSGMAKDPRRGRDEV